MGGLGKDFNYCITFSGFSWDPQLLVAVHCGNTDQSSVCYLISLYVGGRWNMEKGQDLTLSEEKDTLAE